MATAVMKRPKRAFLRAPFEMGERCLVVMLDGRSLVGRVVEKRLCKRLRESAVKCQYDDLALVEYDYYVHFPGADARLDEWITYDRLDLDTVLEPEIEEGKRKRTKVAGGRGAATIKSPDAIAVADTIPQSQSEPSAKKNIHVVHFGSSYRCNAWYNSPYGEDSIDAAKETVHLCEFCLNAYKSQKTMGIHTCARKAPPGKEIYREHLPDKTVLVMFEISGAGLHKDYCRQLCLLGKLFLEHKTVCLNVDTFTFYVLCEEDERGAHIVGYFSKEKHSAGNHNVACLVVLPPFQKKGYGKFLVSVSYELSKRGGNFKASPEKPLSDLAQMCYRRYWSYVLLEAMYANTDNKSEITIDSISSSTGISADDLKETLDLLIEDGMPNLDDSGKIGIHIYRHSLVSFHSNYSNIKLCNPAHLKT